MWVVAATAMAGVDTSAQVGVGAAMQWNPCFENPLGAAPFVFGSVDIGSNAKGVWAFVGMDSSFGLSYAMRECGDVFLTNAVMFTPGVWFGGEVFRFGGFASLGWGGLAFGGRIAVMPMRVGEWRYGFEGRVESLPCCDPTLFSLSGVVAVP